MKNRGTCMNGECHFPLLWGHSRTMSHGVKGTPCKIFIFSNKNAAPFSFWSTPPKPPPQLKNLLLGVGGGVETWFAFCSRCASIQTQV